MTVIPTLCVSTLPQLAPSCFSKRVFRLASHALLLLLLAGCSTLNPWSDDDATGNETSGSEQVAKNTGVKIPGKAQPILPNAVPNINTADDSRQAIAKINTTSDTPADATSAAATSDDLWAALRDDFELGEHPELKPLIEKYERQFSGSKGYFDRFNERTQYYLPFIYQQVSEHSMPGEVALLPAIESAYRPDAVSHANAVGMWQFISSTGKIYGLKQDWWMDERRDVVASTAAAITFLNKLNAIFDGNWELSIAAYNAGEGRILRGIKKNKKLGKPTGFADLEMRRETREYIPKLLAMRNIIRDPAKYGVTLQPLSLEQNMTVVDAGSATDLAVIADLAEIDYEQLRVFNYGYKRGVTPPGGPHRIFLPLTSAQKMEPKLRKLSQNERLRWGRYRVKRGDVLGRIAENHGISVKAIKHSNRLTSNLIKPGQVLRIPLSGQRVLARAKKAQQPASHRVRAGDTLWDLARRYDMSVNKLARLNNLSKRSVLKIGQRLQLR